MQPPAKGSSASADLDFLRGLAAILVAIGHVRLMLILDTNQLAHLPTWAKPFYFVTNLGSSAVMLFFVLSGFLIGSSVIKDVARENFSVRRYGVARISRLYTVLVPALVAGMALDLLGTHFLGMSTVYATPHFGVMLPANVRDDITPAIAVGNLLDLQEILVPTLGSNHPLWSLTNEFWYYVAFPLLVVAVAAGASLVKRLVNVVLFCAVLGLLTPSIRGLFLVWLMGAGMSFLPRIDVRRWHTAIVGLALVGWLAAQSLKFAENPYVTGFITALLVYCLLAQRNRPVSAFYDRLAAHLSSISYTLYLTHTPLAVLTAALILGRGPKLHPDLKGMLTTLAVLGIVIAYAWAMWLLFERRTPAVKTWLSRVFNAPGSRRLAVTSPAE